MKAKKRADPRHNETLAIAIVAALFRNHFGETADRIALKEYTENGERDLGGRNRQNAINAVVRVLEESRGR